MQQPTHELREVSWIVDSAVETRGAVASCLESRVAGWRADERQADVGPDAGLAQAVLLFTRNGENECGNTPANAHGEGSREILAGNARTSGARCITTTAAAARGVDRLIRVERQSLREIIGASDQVECTLASV